MNLIKIGTIIGMADAPKTIDQIKGYGFETFQLTNWTTTGNVDIKENSKQVLAALEGTDIELSSVSIFCNPLRDDEGIRQWERVLDNAKHYGVDLVTGFTGRLDDVSIADNMPRFKQVFSELSKRAADNGLKIAFENCDMGGTWEKGSFNIAHNPTAWEMMYNELPDGFGLEWEPCHQMVSLIKPIPQLRKWVDKIYHVHGKDCTIAWDIVEEYGIDGPKQFAWHRTPGFGDTNWCDVFTILYQNGYQGTVDIEGFHDPVYRENLEYTGQVSGLNYLKKCRGGMKYYTNPQV